MLSVRRKKGERKRERENLEIKGKRRRKPKKYGHEREEKRRQNLQRFGVSQARPDQQELQCYEKAGQFFSFASDDHQGNRNTVY